MQVFIAPTTVHIYMTVHSTLLLLRMPLDRPGVVMENSGSDWLGSAHGQTHRLLENPIHRSRHIINRIISIGFLHLRFCLKSVLNQSSRWSSSGLLWRTRLWPMRPTTSSTFPNFRLHHFLWNNLSILVSAYSVALSCMLFDRRIRTEMHCQMCKSHA